MLIAACCLWAGCAWAGTDQDTAWAEMAKLIDRTEPIQTYTALFEQEKFTPLLRDPIRSSGRVRIAPGISRWDTDEPNASTMLIAKGELRLYYPEQNTLEVYVLGDRLDKMAASPVPELSVLREQFEIDKSSWSQDPRRLEVTLLPKADQMKDAIEAIEVRIDPSMGCLSELSITDLDGETTVLRFSQVKLNPPIDLVELELTVPKGTKVVRPLEGAGG